MKHRPPMPGSERAKQFIPFAALRGYEEALREKEKEVERLADPVLHVEEKMQDSDMNVEKEDALRWWVEEEDDDEDEEI